jgi:hypothetical protein
VAAAIPWRNPFLWSRPPTFRAGVKRTLGRNGLRKQVSRAFSLRRLLDTTARRCIALTPAGPSLNCPLCPNSSGGGRCLRKAKSRNPWRTPSMNRRRYEPDISIVVRLLREHRAFVSGFFVFVAVPLTAWYLGRQSGRRKTKTSHTFVLVIRPPAPTSGVRPVIRWNFEPSSGRQRPF